MNNYIDEILFRLNHKPLFGLDYDSTIFTRATDDPEVIANLKVRKQDGTLTDDVFVFLDEHNRAEKQFYKVINNAVWAHTNLNPRQENPYVDYFVDNAIHIKNLEDLLAVNMIGTNLILFDDKVTFQIGKKGSGKTISQNVWLHKNHTKLESNKIFWVRLDMEKLYKLWKKGKYITTEEYFLGQLLYVFCKRFRKFSYIDTATNPPIEKSTHSDLIYNIYQKLTESPLNDIPETNLTKAQETYLNDAQIIFQNKTSKKNYKRITDYLIAIEEIIAKDEKTYKSAGNSRLPYAPNRKRSFLIHDVFQDKTSKLFKAWIFLGEMLKNFILDEGYNILYIVDGIDNINFEDATELTNYKMLLEQLIDFPLNMEKVGHPHEFIFMAMRHNTFEDLKKYYYGYAVSRSIHDLQTASVVDNKKSKIGEEILKKRVDYVLQKSKWKDLSYLAKVLDIVKVTHANIVDEEK
ncbi:hypothetical protein LJC69_06355 [Bacteroidales bacterium OttesenSCG-928-K22]|nr:hypothetical protein [Bacteroidales bacterium OttesenSCG-928-L14]MDL2241230.1 hypothetical protein [Bacteroidales bacterium OttesenSCG-928-K22]